jgi:CheY-like chemotaxis protein
MEVVCDQCQGKFRIPDEKMPTEQVVFIPCPRCKKKLTIDTRTNKPSIISDPIKTVQTATPTDKNMTQTISSSVYDASEKPFDFLVSGVKTALVCESDSGILSKLRFSLKQMGYHTTETGSAMDALKKMRFHSFDLIVMNELFDCESAEDHPILTFLNELTMSARRNIFVALISTRFRTMDNMAAFNKSVNVVIHERNLDEAAKILRRAIDEHQVFYSVFQSSLIETGRG